MGVLKERLEPDLGPAKLVGDTYGEDQGLVFHPRDFRGPLARRRRESWSSSSSSSSSSSPSSSSSS